MVRLTMASRLSIRLPEAGRVASVVAIAIIAASAPAGELSKTKSITERLRNDVAAAPLSMRFNGVTAEECRSWQKTFAVKLKSLLGPHTPPSRWQAQGKETEMPDHQRF